MHQPIVLYLTCDIAKHRAAGVASTPMIQAGLAAKLGQWAGPKAALTEPAAANSGVDFTAGARLRSEGRKTPESRTGKLKNRLRRFRTLRAAGAGTRKIWSTGLQQAGYFGADILGLT
eukprot:9498431-Pyramimonas_sp.AAC.1